MSNNEESDSFFEELFDMASELKEGQVQTGLMSELQETEGRYGSKEFFAQGGMKKIYKVHDYQTDRTVAMACLDDDKDKISKESFLREARVTAQLQHPNIVAIYDMGLEAEQPYFTMKFLQGQTLEDFLTPNDFQAPGKEQDLPNLLSIFRKICDAVAYAHSRGVIHLDLKPANIHLSEYGEVTVCDWGLAKVIDQICDDESVDKYSLDYFDLNNHTLDGYIKGTMGFMSPEQLGNKQKKDQRSDIYSLGAILYKILSKRQIIHAQNAEEYCKLALQGKIDKPSKFKEGIPESLEAVCMKCLELHSNNRYQSVDDLISELDAYLNGYATSAEHASVVKQAKLFYQRNRQVCIAVAASLIIIFAGLISFLIIIEKAYLDLQEEKAAKEKIASSSAIKYYEEAERNYKEGNIEGALLALETVKFLDPDFEGHADFHYEILLMGGRFDELKNFQDLDRLDGWLETQGTYDNKFFEAYLTKIRALDDKNLYKYVQRYSHRDHLKTFKEQEEYLRFSLLMDNPKTKEMKVKYDGRKLDLSHNRIKDISAIHAVDVYELDLSFSGIRHLRYFEKNKIEILNLSNSQLMHIPDWRNAKLKKMDLSHTPVMFIGTMSQPTKYQIDELDLTGTAVMLEPLRRNKAIKKIYVGRATYDQQSIHQGRYIVRDQTPEEILKELRLLAFHKLNRTKDDIIDPNEFTLDYDLFFLWDENADDKLTTGEFMPLDFVRENKEMITRMFRKKGRPTGGKSSPGGNPPPRMY